MSRKKVSKKTEEALSEVTESLQALDEPQLVHQPKQKPIKLHPKFHKFLKQ